MSMVNADSVQLFAMLKKMQDSISSIETTKKSVKMKYEQLSGHKIISEKSHRPVAFSFWEGSDGNGSDKIDCTPCE